MDTHQHSDVQVQNAIEIAWSSTSEHALKAQAFDFLNELRSNPAAAHICLSLFSRQPPLDDVVRHFSLEVVNNAIQSSQLDPASLIQIKDGLMQYLRRLYSSLTTDLGPDSSVIQNKLAQTLTYLFEALYPAGWELFFHDILQLVQNPSTDSSDYTGPAALFYLRVLASVHDEIADQMVHTTPEKQRLFTELKDLIRARDASRISLSWQHILSNWESAPVSVTQLCLKTIGRWVSWSDISLVVNDSIIPLLSSIATAPSSDDASSNHAKRRDAAVDVYTEIVAKKMRPPEKVDLIRFLDLHTLVSKLTCSKALSDLRGRPDYDTDMAEVVAKLVDHVTLDIVKTLDVPHADHATRQQAETQLQHFVPHLLRFFSDEYDEVCSTVIPALTELLTLFRKLSKSPGGLYSPYDSMVKPILDAIIAKMRYDDTSSWGEEGDETDEAEFQELRKRLRVQQQIVAAIDENLYIDTVAAIINSTLSRAASGFANVEWRDLDLAMLEMFTLGEMAIKNGGLYQKKEPSSAASACLIQMMSSMIEAGISSYPHPTIHLQFMETCVKFWPFFEHHSHYIPRVLEAFVQFVHSQHLKVRARSYPLFLRFVKSVRSNLGNISVSVINAIQDVLVVRADVGDEGSTDDMSSNENSQSADSLFNSQLNLFEAIGCLASGPSVAKETQVSVARTVLEPLSADIEQNMSTALNRDERAILQIHHVMMAIGNLAKGFHEWTDEVNAGPSVPEEVSVHFSHAANVILSSLQSLKWSMDIRTAARFAFARLIGVLRVKVLEQLPQWIDGFLAQSSTKDEMATFLRLLDQVTHKFKGQIYETLDLLFTPLLHRVLAALGQESSGTDDEIQLGELRREYITFLLIILNNELEPILISPTNQGAFDLFISTLEHFAKDTSEHTEAKLALSVFTKMCMVWGGPEVFKSGFGEAVPSPALAGFDQYMMTRFSPLTWAIMTSAGFDPKEPHSNRVIGEIANLQQAILARTGREYLTYLREVELKNLGAQAAAIDEYSNALVTTDSKAFKTYLLRFLRRGGAT